MFINPDICCTANFFKTLAASYLNNISCVFIDVCSSCSFLALNWNKKMQIDYRMDPQNKKHRESEEKEWENPVNPALTTDERDKEQLLRQYKEAKRRKDNLTTEETDTKK